MPLTPDNEKQLKDLLEEQLKLKERGLQLDEQKEKKLHELLGLQDKSRIATQENLELQKKLAAQYAEVAKNNKKTVEFTLIAHEQAKQALQTKIRLLKEEFKVLNETEEIYKKKLAHIKEAEKELVLLNLKTKQIDQLKASVKDSADAAEGLGAALGKAMSLKESKNFVGGMQSVIMALQNSAKVSAAAFASSAVDSILTSWVNNIVGIAISLVDMENSFRRATGASAEFAKSVTTTYEQTRQFGVTSEDASKAAQALYTSYTDFTFLAEDTRVDMQNTIATLSKLGISMEDMAKGSQVATKMMGVSARNTAALQEDLASYAQEIGVAPSRMAQQFAAAGPSLAKFGDDGVRVFKDLQRTSKITGMEMDKLLQITNKFDTFEGAATQAGKLNAALGGNFVNAMDLMMQTDPGERFDMIRGAIEGAGLSFDTMSYYQKNFYKDALGLDSVGDLALVLSGNQDMLAGSTQKSAKEYEELAEQALAMQSIQEQFNAAIAESAPVFKELISMIQTLLPHISTVIKAWKIWLPLLVLGKIVMMAWSLKVGMATVANAGLTTSVTAETTAEISNALAKLNNIKFTGKSIGPNLLLDKTTKNLGTTSAWSAKQIAAVGLAALGIGAGIGAAAYGLSYLAKSFEDLGWAAIPATAAIIGFTAAFGALMLGLVALVAGPQAAATGAAVGVLLAVGGAALLIGAGMGAAAYGISLMVKEIGGVSATSFIGFAISMGMLAGALSLFALPTTLLGIASFAAFALVLSTVKTAAKGIQDLAVAMQDLGRLDMSDSIKQMGKLVSEISKVDTAQSRAFTTAMNAVTTSIIEVKQMPTAAVANTFQAQAQAQPATAGNTTVQVHLDVGETRTFLQDVFESGMAEYVVS